MAENFPENDCRPSELFPGSSSSKTTALDIVPTSPKESQRSEKGLRFDFTSNNAVIKIILS